MKFQTTLSFRGYAKHTLPPTQPVQEVSIGYY